MDSIERVNQLFAESIDTIARAAERQASPIGDAAQCIVTSLLAATGIDRFSGPSATTRISGLVGLVEDAVGKGDKVGADVVRALLDALHSGEGTGHARVALGQALGRAGDPRLRSPSS